VMGIRECAAIQNRWRLWLPVIDENRMAWVLYPISVNSVMQHQAHLVKFECIPMVHLNTHGLVPVPIPNNTGIVLHRYGCGYSMKYPWVTHAIAYVQVKHRFGNKFCMTYVGK
jgi:hypothetical protein